MSVYKDDPVVGAFSAMLKHYAMMRMLDTVSKLSSPTDISFSERETADYGEYKMHHIPENKQCIESNFKDDDEIVFYMILDYPLEFSCCHAKDFCQAYLNARSRVKVQLPEKYLTWHYVGQEVIVDQIRYKYFGLNRCVPLLHTTFGKLKEFFREFRISDYNLHPGKGHIEIINGIHHDLDCVDSKNNGKKSSRDVIRCGRIVEQFLTYYRDYLIYCSEYFYAIEHLGRYEYGWEEAKKSHNYHKRISNGFRDEIRDNLVHSDTVDISLGSDCNYLIKNHYPLVDVTGPVVLDHCNDEDDYYLVARKYKFGDSKFWFDDFVEEAKKIQDKNDPRYKDMLDIDELYIYDLYKRFHTIVDLEFLKQDWYDKPSWEMK